MAVTSASEYLIMTGVNFSDSRRILRPLFILYFPGNTRRPSELYLRLRAICPIQSRDGALSASDGLRVMTEGDIGVRVAGYSIFGLV
jgi:hypothetical protein